MRRSMLFIPVTHAQSLHDFHVACVCPYCMEIRIYLVYPVFEIVPKQALPKVFTRENMYLVKKLL